MYQNFILTVLAIVFAGLLLELIKIRKNIVAKNSSEETEHESDDTEYDADENVDNYEDEDEDSDEDEDEDGDENKNADNDVSYNGSKKGMIDIAAYLEEELGIKIKDLNRKQIDELIKGLRKLPPDQVIVEIKD